MSELIVASKNGDVGRVRFLLEDKADVNERQSNGVTSLIMASYGGYYDVVKILLENKADVNARQNNGATSLVAASYKGHYAIAKLLIDNKADVNLGQANGATPLIAALKEKHYEIVDLLLTSGAKAFDAANSSSTVIVSTLNSSVAEIVKLFVDCKNSVEPKTEQETKHPEALNDVKIEEELKKIQTELGLILEGLAEEKQAAQTRNAELVKKIAELEDGFKKQESEKPSIIEDTPKLVKRETFNDF